jgi:hypothetical protein
MAALKKAELNRPVFHNRSAIERFRFRHLMSDRSGNVSSRLKIRLHGLDEAIETAETIELFTIA